MSAIICSRCKESFASHTSRALHLVECASNAAEEAERFMALYDASQAKLAAAEAENAHLRDALNRIGLLGHSEHAYSREFTKRVRSIVNSALKGEGR